MRRRRSSPPTAPASTRRVLPSPPSSTTAASRATASPAPGRAPARVAVVINNKSTGIIYGNGNFGAFNVGTGNLTVTNDTGGVIVGAVAGVSGNATGVTKVSNAGTIGTGTVSGAGIFTIGGAGFGVTAGSVAVTNSGTISSSAAAIRQTDANATLTLVNTGTLSQSAYASVDPADVVIATGVANILNSGTISTPSYYGVVIGKGGTLTNAASGSIMAGNAGGRYGVVANGAAGTTTTIDNYGTISGTAGLGIQGGAGDTVTTLRSGSTTGAIATGAGSDTLTIYTGQTNATAVTQGYNDAVTGLSAGTVTLQGTGTLAAAVVGAVNLGGGTNSVALRGTGDGGASGAAGSFSLTGGGGLGTLTKQDGGTWTLTGTGNAGLMQINAGTGGSQAANGLLIFSGTGLTSAIKVNGATIRATTAGGFGTGTITTVDPTVQYAATGTYANNIVLSSAAPTTDPTILQTFGTGITATLTGQITQAAGAAQPLVFSSVDSAGVQNTGTFILTNGTNSFNGLTTITIGTTVVERNTGTALGVGGVQINGGATLELANTNANPAGSAPSVTVGPTTFTGTGTLVKSGTGYTAFGGNAPFGGNGNVNVNLSQGALIDVQGGYLQGSSTFQGLWTNNKASLNIASGATFNGVEGTIFVDALTGSGTLLGGQGGVAKTTTVGVADGSGTFAGTIGDYTSDPGSKLALTKAGTGTQTLTGANTYTGATTISGGTLALSLGGTLTASTITNNATFDISTHTSGASILNLLGSGNTTLGANTLTITAASGTYTGTFTGTGGLTVSGNYALSGTGNAYSGTTTINSGATLQGTTDTFSPNSTVIDNGTLTFSRSGTGSFAPSVSGTGKITVSGVIAGPTITFAGALTNAGGLTLGTAGNATISGSVSNASSTGAVQVAAFGDVLTVASGGSITSTQSAAGDFASAVYGTPSNFTVTNAGTITAPGDVGATNGSNGIYAAIGVTVNNTGKILGVPTGSNAVYRSDGVFARLDGSIINNTNAALSGGVLTGTPTAGGVITGGWDGVFLNGGTVFNAGDIAGNLQVAIERATTVTNYATGRLINGISLQSGVQVTNAGLIVRGSYNSATAAITAGTTGPGVGLASGTVANNAGGRIIGGSSNNGNSDFSYGVLSTGALTLTNAAAGGGLRAGQIVGGYAGVEVRGLADITNDGLIASGMLDFANVGTAVTSGYTLGGQDGIRLLGGGTVTNNAGALIRSTASGIYSEGAAATLALINSGTVASGNGLYVAATNQAVTTTNNAAGIIVGTAGYGVFNNSPALTKVTTNAGQIVGTSGGVAAGGAIDITNSGTIGSGTLSGAGGVSGTFSTTGGTGRGISASSGGSVTNSGLIQGATQAGLYSNGGTLTVGNTGTIATAGTGAFDGITSQGKLTLTNIAVRDGNGTLTGGIITAANASGVAFVGAGSSVDNSGRITGGSSTLYGYGVQADGSGSITNQANGILNGGYGGVIQAAAGVTIDNSGAIYGGDATSYGVRTTAGALALTNRAGGTVAGRTYGVYADTAGGSITNVGVIASGSYSPLNGQIAVGGADAIYLVAGGSITNGSLAGTLAQNLTSMIAGPTAILSGGLLNLTNYGVVTSTTGDAILPNAGGTITNGGAGLTAAQNFNARIEGTNSGVNSGSGSALLTVNNYGRIVGDAYSGSGQGFGATGAFTLTNFAGGVVAANGAAGSTAYGAYAIGGGKLTVTNGGLITARQYAVYGTNAADSVTNTGTIQGGFYNVTTGAVTAGGIAAVYLTAGGTVSNGALANTAAQNTASVISGPIGLLSSAALTLNNYGQIAGTGTNVAGVNARGAASKISNAGAIGGGAQAIVLNSGGSVFNTATGTLSTTNAAALNDASGLYANGALTLVNLGSISTINTGASFGVEVIGAASIVNAGTITAATRAAVSTGSGTVQNAAAGTLQGGTSATQGYGLVQSGGSVSNYGTIRGGAGDGLGISGGNGGLAITLYAGSTTGSVATGSGNNQLSLYTGTVNAAALTTQVNDPVTGAASSVTLQNAGTIAAAVVGSIDLGTGANTLSLRGTGDGQPGNGAASALTLTGNMGLTTITKLDTGTWTLNGSAASTGTTRIDAGLGGTPGNAGLLIFNGTTGLTADIYVNGGTIRSVANGGASSFGSGTITMIDPTTQFQGTQTVANNYVLAVSSPAANNPSVFQTVNGVATVTLNGSITTGTTANNPGIDASQPLTFDGVSGSMFILGNPANSWSGVTQINAGITLQGTTATISGGSVFDNGTLAFVQAASGTFAKNIAGGGLITVAGLAAGNALILSGAITSTGGLVVTDASNVTLSGSINASHNTGYVTLGSGTFTNTGAITTTSFDAIETAPTLNGTVVNSGTIQGGASGVISLNAGNTSTLTVTNTGRIQGVQFDGVTQHGAVALTVTNTGSSATTGIIYGQNTSGSGNGYGVGSDGGGKLTVTNSAGGKIVGQYGVVGTNAGDSVTNSGTIASGTIDITTGAITVGKISAVELRAGGTVTNNTGASLRGGTGLGVYFAGGALGTVINSGTIAASTGVFTFNPQNQALSVTNNIGAVIVGTGGQGVNNSGLGLTTITNDGQIVGSATAIGTDGAVDITNTGLIGAGTLSSGTSGAFAANRSGRGISTRTGGTIRNNGGTIRASTDAAIFSNGAVTLTNTGTIATGANATAVMIGGGSIVNGAFANTAAQNMASTIGGVDAIIASGALSLDNFGAISGTVYESSGGAALRVVNRQGGTITDTGDAVYTLGTLNLVNGGAITAGSNSGVGANTIGGNGQITLVNATTGTIVGGTDATYGGAIQLGGVAGVTNTVDNYGMLNAGGNGSAIYGFNNNTNLISLQAGSTTGAINLTNGNDTVSLFTGTGTGFAGLTYDTVAQTTGSGTTVDATHVLIQKAGTNAAAVVGAINLGGGANTLNLTGSGTGLNGTGAAGTLNVATVSGATTISKTGTGIWALSGTDTGTTTAVNVQAGLLTVTGGNAIADAAALTIASGATLGLLANETVGTIAGAGSVALGISTLTLAGNASTTFSGVASGSGGITKQGSGTLTLSGANGFTGTLLINGGIVKYGMSNVLADTSTVTVGTGTTLDLNSFSDTIGTLNLYGTLANGGALTATTYNAYAGSTIGQAITSGSLNIYGDTALNSATAANPVNIYAGTLTTGRAELIGDLSAVNIQAGGSLALGGAETIGSLANLDGSGGTVQLGTNALTVGGNNANTAFSGTLTGTGGSLIKVGTGTLTLSGQSSYTGGTTVSVGRLVEQNVTLPGGTTLVSSGAVLEYNTTSGILYQDGATITGAGTVQKTGAGVLSNRSLIAMAAGGVLDVQAGEFRGSSDGVGRFTGNSGSLNIAAGATFNGVEGNVVVDGLTGSGTLTGGLSGFGSTTIGSANGSATFAGLIADNTNGTNSPLTLIKIGTGTQTLTGTGTYTGATTINAGTLIVSGGQAIGDASAVTVSSGAVFQVATNETVGSLAGEGSVLLGGTLTAGGDNTSTTFAGVASGSGGLTKAGLGALTLSGANGYTGATVVGGGVLALGASGVIADASDLVVATGATFALGGFDEAVNTAVIGGTVSGTGGTLSAASYLLNGATVTGNLGAGALTQAGGVSTLSGTAAAGTVVVTGGTLALGAGERLADTAAVSVASGAILDLGMFTDTVGSLALNGSLNGSGTLTAASYTLTGGIANANLGAGVLTNAGGTSTLNGTSGATTVSVNAGSLALGAADRLVDAGAVSVASGAILDLGMFTDTVGSLALNGSLNGSGTLTATSYTLNAASVNANLGAGVLTNAGGTSTLNGTSGATTVNVNAGTLALGAANRLADAGAVSVTSGAILDLKTFSDTVATLALGGSLNGSGTLTAASYALNGGTANANLGAGTLTQTGGTSTLNGTAGATTVSVNAGSLALGAANRLADAGAVSVASGAILDLKTFSDTVATLALNGTLNGSGTLTAASYMLNGGTANANLGAGVLTNAGGTSTLNGTSGATTVNVNAGTLALGAADRLADTSAVSVASGAVLDLKTFSDTVATLALGGSLNGSGTLTAATYALNGGTANANLGAGTLTNAGGTSTLNGTAGATTVNVNAGTLTLGAANRLADAGAVSVASGAVLDLKTFSDAVATLALNGTLNGTGTLTAASYTLNAASVNANLGAGTLTNAGGTSTLTGTAGAATVTVTAGSLRLGADERLLDTSAVSVATGAAFDLNGRTETVGSVTGAGTTALGSGRLVLAGSGASSLGALTGTGNIDKTGTGTLTLASAYASTGSINTSAGTTAFTGTSAGSLRVAGGSLTGTGTAAGALGVTGGTVAPGLAGGTAPTAFGTLTVGSFAMTGGTYAIEFGGPASGYASDLIRVTGAASLGGAVSVTPIGFVPTDRFQQTYTVVQAGSVTGTFTNLNSFTQSSADPALFYRLRYDLQPNAVVLQVQRQIDFAAALPGGTGNQQALGRALTGTAGNASDSFAATLNAIATSGGDRGATYDSLSGEAITDVTTGALFVGDQFVDLLRARVGLRGGGAAGAAQYALRAGVTDGQRHANGFAGALEDGINAGGGTASSSGGGVWLQGYGAGRRLRGEAGQARTDSFVSGLAGGIDAQLGPVSVGVAGGFSDLDTKVQTRGSKVAGTLYQGGAYIAYDGGTLYGQLAGDYYGGDVTVTRALAIGGSVVGQAAGTTSVRGYTLGALVGARADLGGGTRAGIELTAQETQGIRRAYTETAPLGLGLTAARSVRDVFTGTAQVKLSHLFTGNGWTAEPFASGGVEVHSGDLATIGAMQIGAAPTGTGGFLVQGATIEHTLGTFTGGIEIRPADRFRLDLSAGGKIGNRTREGQIKVSARIAL